MKKLRLITLLSFTIFAGTVFSQVPPVTFIKFYKDYQTLDEIQHIKKYGNLDGKIAYFLAEDANSIDEKAAIINALANDERAKNNVETLSMFLGRKYGMPWQNLNYEVLTGAELFCLGYLTIADNAGDPSKAMELLEMGKARMMESYTVNVIYALAQAQSLINSKDECGAWQAYESVLNDNKLSKDMSANAIGTISNGMAGYSDKCD